MAESIRWGTECWFVACAEDASASPVYRNFTSLESAQKFAMDVSATERKAYYIYHVEKCGSAHPQPSKLY